MALRYGEEEMGSYFIAYTDDLEVAKKMADDEWEYRGCMKYSGVVYEIKKESKIKIEVYRKGM